MRTKEVHTLDQLDSYDEEEIEINSKIVMNTRDFIQRKIDEAISRSGLKKKLELIFEKVERDDGEDVRDDIEEEDTQRLFESSGESHKEE
jgi:hypothetical protein